ncbi:MAG: DNA helicase RecG, partial [Patescibacteria group bacterium]|nr:DNA helicase RecG [Patescibacteria group bacterium]
IVCDSKFREAKPHNSKQFDGDFDILIGTHSLLYEKAKFKNLALVVIDEQHRFGVEQRAVLWGKGNNPHLLSMTATPIPRTIALAVYGDMDLSYLDEMPAGRLKIKTWVVPNEKRDSANAWLSKQLKENNSQCFIICPLIEEPAMPAGRSENLVTIKAAKAEFDRTKKNFPDFRVGLLHGKLKSAEKTNVINQFRQHKLDILVSTPVVEVGIDIANAAVMFIEGADRFGLAQLHQLRGRVGRGDIQSYCFLFTENNNKEALTRLKNMEKYQIGEKLAEEDLKLRGPGELFGVKQHGFGTLKIASFSDFALMAKAKREAEALVAKNHKLNFHPLLQKKIEKFLNLETNQ